MRLRRYWYIGIGIVIAIVVVLVVLLARTQWADSIPSKPSRLPESAIWIPAPSAVLDFTPRGYWLACWLDHTRNVDRCELTDYKGKVVSVADYSPISGPNPVPESQLHFKAMNSSELWAVAGQELVPVALLRNGTVLVPTQNLAQLRPVYLPHRTQLKP